MAFTLARMIGIKGGIILALLLALGFTMWRADTFSDRLERQVQATANEKAAHSITRASLDRCEQRHAAMIADGKRRSDAAADALRAQQGRSAALGEQIARIRAEKPPVGNSGACRSPSAVLRAEGL